MAGSAGSAFGDLLPPLPGGKGLLDVQPHWVSALAWPREEAETLWCGEPKDLLLVGRMDGSLGLIEVLDSCSMQRTELEHCYRKDGRTELQNRVLARPLYLNPTAGMTQFRVLLQWR